MRKYVWPVVAIALPLLVAGAWVAFPQERESACSAVSSFLASFVAETKAAWGRAFGGGGDAEDLVRIVHHCAASFSPAFFSAASLSFFTASSKAFQTPA